MGGDKELKFTNPRLKLSDNFPKEVKVLWKRAAVIFGNPHNHEITPLLTLGAQPDDAVIRDIRDKFVQKIIDRYQKVKKTEEDSRSEDDKEFIARIEQFNSEVLFPS